MIAGQILLELLISTMIAGIISTGLLTTIFQVNRVQQTINTIAGVYGRVAIAQNLLERDIMGAFIPAQVDVMQTSTLKTEQIKPIEKIFYGTSKNEGGRFDLLTFITSNPLEVFYGVKNSKLKPRAARIVYRLIPDERRKNSYILMRQEGTTNLSFDAYKADATGELRAFAVIDGIQNLTMNYISIAESAAEKGKQAQRTYKKATTWQSEQKKEPAAGKTTSKKEPIKLPNQLEITLSLWDSTFTDARSFQLIIPIMYKATEFEQPPKKEEQKPGISTTPGGLPGEADKAKTGAV